MKGTRDARVDILQIIPDLGLAGAERMCQNLATELHSRGYRVAVASLFNRHTPITAELEKVGVETFFLGKNKGLDLSMLAKLHRLIQHLMPRVVHSHRHCEQYLLPAHIGFGKSIRWVHTIHNVAAKEVSQPIQKVQSFAFSRRLTLPVAISETVRDTVHDLYHLPIDEVPIVYNGIPPYEPNQVNDLPGKQDVFTFLSIGRAMKQKNQLTMIRAFACFHQQFPATKLLIIGDGMLFSEITSEIKKLHAENFIIQLGRVSNARDYYYVSDAFLLPSLFEGMPMTIIEAMTAGIPVLASNRGGTVDIVRDGKTGYLCEPDEDGIFEGLVRLYKDPLCQQIAAAGMASSKRFTAKAMADGYEELYGI